jgi:hypothetical protein
MLFELERSSQGLNVFVLKLQACLFFRTVKALAFCSFVANPCFLVADAASTLSFPRGLIV